MNQKTVSIVIPCYNEQKNLEKGVLAQVYSFLKKQKFQWQVLLCNDASTDDSLKLLKQFAKKHKGFKVLDLPHGGKPGAVWGGIQKAKYPWVLFTDMDQSTPLKELNKLLPFTDKYQLIIGSRGQTRHGFSPIRKIMSAVFLTLRRLALLPEIKDTQCGFKLIKTDLAKKIFPNLGYFKITSSSGWRVSAFDVELLFMAKKWGYKIKEVPVNWKDEDLSTTKGDNLTRFKKESRQMAQEILRVRLNDLKGVYGQKK